MKYDIFHTIFVTLLCLGSIWAIFYNFYMSWFKPLQFLERAAKGVRDSWPFANYFRSYYSSLKWLWITRFLTTILVLGILLLIYKLLLFQVNLSP
jgi:hypothetical protein